MPTAPERTVDDESSGTGLLEALWRFKGLSIAIIAVFTLLGLLASYPSAGTHTGTVVVALKDPRGSIALQGSGVTASDLPRYTTRRSDFADTQTNLQVAADLAGTNVSNLRNHVSITPDPNTDAFHIVATAPSSEAAISYATSVARAYQQLSKDELNAQFADATRALDAEKSSLQATITASPTGPQATAAAATLTQLAVRRAELSETAAVFGDGVDYIGQARVASSGKTTPIRDGLIGAIFGVLVASLVAWFLAARRPWATHADQVAYVVDAPFLGDVNNARSVRQLSTSLTASRDGYEIVSTTVSALVSQGILLVVSPNQTLGRSESALQTAVAAVRDGRRVLIVDADNKRRYLTQALALTDHPGLVDLLRGNTSLGDVARTLTFEDVSFDAIASGPHVDDPASLYQSQNAVQFLANAREAYDLVIIDCAPLLGSAAASVLARGADRVVLVVESGTALSNVKRANQQLGLLGLPVVGFVFTQRRSSSATTRAANR